MFLGAICGAVLTALCLKLPQASQFVGNYGYDFQIAFGRFFGEHIFPVLTGFGAVIGAAMGGSLAVSKRWCALLLTFIAGMAIGGAAMFFVEVKVVKWASGMWEQGYETQKAVTYLQCLRAIDRGTTNGLFLVQFQNEGRVVLTSYVHQVEKWETVYGAGPNTNSPFYKWAQEYLATHTNSLPIGKGYEDSNLAITNSAADYKSIMD